MSYKEPDGQQQSPTSSFTIGYVNQALDAQGRPRRSVVLPVLAHMDRIGQATVVSRGRLRMALPTRASLINMGTG